MSGNLSNLNPECINTEITTRIWSSASTYLYWFGHTICVSNPSELDNYRSLCSEPWSLVWLVPQAVQRDYGKHSRGIDSCLSPDCWDARWLPDWFSGPLPIVYRHFSLSVSEVCSRGRIFWTCAKSFSVMNLLLTCLRFDLWTEVIKSTVFDSRSR